MAREQVGTAPVRDDDAVTVSWVRAQLAALASSTQGQFVNNEIPLGIVDGQNLQLGTQFHFIAGTTDLYVNGIREAAGLTYVEQSPNVLVLSSPPLPGDDIFVSYQRS